VKAANRQSWKKWNVASTSPTLDDDLSGHRDPAVRQCRVVAEMRYSPIIGTQWESTVERRSPQALLGAAPMLVKHGARLKADSRAPPPMTAFGI